MIICIQFIHLNIHLFLCLFWVIYFSHIKGTLHRRWAIPQSDFCNRLEVPGNLLMCLSLPFLIILRVPTITGTVVVLRCHFFFSISIYKTLYLFVSLYSFKCHLSLGSKLESIMIILLFESFSHQLTLMVFH